MSESYRGWILTHNPPPIGTRMHDWQAHREGDEEAGSLTAPTREALMREIDYEEDEWLAEGPNMSEEGDR